jgi:hypothetical protein
VVARPPGSSWPSRRSRARWKRRSRGAEVTIFTTSASGYRSNVTDCRSTSACAPVERRATADHGTCGSRSGLPRPARASSSSASPAGASGRPVRPDPARTGSDRLSSTRRGRPDPDQDGIRRPRHGAAPERGQVHRPPAGLRPGCGWRWPALHVGGRGGRILPGGRAVRRACLVEERAGTRASRPDRAGGGGALSGWHLGRRARESARRPYAQGADPHLEPFDSLARPSATLAISTSTCRPSTAVQRPGKLLQE